MSDETDRAKNYADWNNRPKMDAAEFADNPFETEEDETDAG